MTFDKQSNGNLAKPFTPTLSAAFHRNKSPLTPKLASPSPGPGFSAGRRLAQPDHPYSTPSKDPPAVPPTYLSANVTPRSGARTTRRDGTNASPTNTPVPAPHTPYSQSTIGYGRRTDRSPARGVKPAQSRSLKGPTLSAENQPISRPNSFSDMASGSPLFFHASDARSSHPSEVEALPIRPQGKPSPASSFVYANGDQERKSLGDQSSTTSSVVRRRSGGYSRPLPTVKQTASPSPRLSSAKLSDATSTPPDVTKPPYPQNAEQGLGIVHRFSPPSSTVSDRPPIGRHTKSSSVDSSHHALPHDSLRSSPVIVPGNYFSEGSAPVMSEQIPTLRPRIFSNGSSMNGSTVSNETYPQAPLSPGKSDGPSEAALNARTERKIMDLEISNSSLLAINRTLEREMRKQNAELRRFRRLSRSGRISMAPSTRSFSGAALSTTSEMDEGASELSMRSQDDMSDISDEDSLADDGVTSPGSLAEHDVKQRAQDEKRFMLDLAKHQELLADSQKMNQSLKRCLGWTEELIREGQRALEYNVHVQDIELGGRVLAPEELGEVGESGRGLLSPSTEYDGVFSPVESSSIGFSDEPSIALSIDSPVPPSAPELTT
ncbi:hypothetical protein PENANT_c018G11111 [Penicillium antarcticum]|uniref:Uncharacterized protein n=1 Tax=Penicillium antarcticum TaxID=416450 RepID=A0A1V6Q295_9EURO|nr:uncharacterized protein N7508_003911 [Penicillium antarcticum]KAJ5313081.1 hypothetical protein N7508_003911 [Penicillium antarcticum]OQD83167.1 hypothetical protein PENANT_c018G11111 [Penicillium antarcticum]